MKLNYLRLLKLAEESGAEPPAEGGAPPAVVAEPTSLNTLLSEGYREEASLVDFKDVDSLAKGYMDLKQYQGQSLRIPSSDAGDEQMAEFRGKVAEMDGVMLRPDFTNPEQAKDFYRSLGAPEDSAGYEFTPPEELASVEMNSDRVNMFREVAMENGLTKAQFNGILSKVVQADMLQVNAQTAERETDVQGLRQEWGHAYDQNMEIALSVARATGAPQKVQDAMVKGETGADFNKWMYTMSKQLGGEGTNFDRAERTDYQMSPAEIQGQISDIMNNDKHPYWDRGHPDHTAAVQGMLDLQRKLHK